MNYLGTLAKLHRFPRAVLLASACLVGTPLFAQSILMPDGRLHHGQSIVPTHRSAQP